MKMRIAFTVALLVAWAIISSLVNVAAPIISGNAAVLQFQNSDVAYVGAQYGMRWFVGRGLPLLVLLAGMLAIWWQPLKSKFSKTVAGALMVVALLSSTSAYAYYDKTDYAEWMEIQPNQSAFLIPLVGANKTSQAQFMSEQYLTDNKVAAKRIQIPHTKLDNSGTFSNFYVPSAKLILVDRTPYARVWHPSPTKGTSTKNEGLECESADSLNVELAVAVSAFVTEENASKFLYWFGTTTTQFNTTDYDKVYSSVSYGKSLAEVMDTQGWAAVQTAICREVSSRLLEIAINAKSAIMDAGFKTVQAQLAAKGITVETLGWASSWTFDSRIQAAIDQRFIAMKDAQAFDDMSKIMPIRQLQAQVEIQRQTALAIGKWNGNIPMPSVLLTSDGILGAISGFFGWGPAPAAALKK